MRESWSSGRSEYLESLFMRGNHEPRKPKPRRIIMPETTLSFAFEKETKNCIRFKEQTTGDAKPIIGTLYLQKEAAGDTKALTVTIATAA
jgi:hypothetical protein